MTLRLFRGLDATVAVRLAGGGVLKTAAAGKPDCYGPVRLTERHT